MDTDPIFSQPALPGPLLRLPRSPQQASPAFNENQSSQVWDYLPGEMERPVPSLDSGVGDAKKNYLSICVDFLDLYPHPFLSFTESPEDSE